MCCHIILHTDRFPVYHPMIQIFFQNIDSLCMIKYHAFKIIIVIFQVLREINPLFQQKVSAVKLRPILSFLWSFSCKIRFTFLWTIQHKKCILPPCPFRLSFMILIAAIPRIIAFYHVAVILLRFPVQMPIHTRFHPVVLIHECYILSRCVLNA